MPRHSAAEDYLDLPMMFQINDEQLDNFKGKREIALLNTLMEYGKSKFNFQIFYCLFLTKLVAKILLRNSGEKFLVALKTTVRLVLLIVKHWKKFVILWVQHNSCNCGQLCVDLFMIQVLMTVI